MSRTRFQNATTSYRRIRRLKELFRGRFSDDEANSLLTHFRWNISEAVNFAFTEDPQTVRGIIGTENEEWQIVKNKREWRELAQRGEIPYEERQFSCRECDNVWWRRVPNRKAVSRCKRCGNRYEAVPRDAEWGWAHYLCQKCRYSFGGFGQMNNTWSPCYIYTCSAPCQPISVFPRMPRVSRRTRDIHSCFGCNCFSRAVGPQMSERCVCVHPRSLKKRVVTACQQHTSTGSTVDTFLTQDDLISQVSDVDFTLPDVDERSDNGK